MDQAHDGASQAMLELQAAAVGCPIESGGEAQTERMKTLSRFWNRLRRSRPQETRQFDNLSVMRNATKYHTRAHPGEDYYREQYWHWIEKYLESQGLPKDGNYLDAGCGPGRMAVRFAKWAAEGKVLGIDLAEAAIQEATRHAKETGTPNSTFAVGEMCSFLQNQPDGFCDAIMFLEAAFFFPEFRSALAKMARVLKPGGLLFASFRPQYFYLLATLKNGRRWQEAAMVLERREGRLWGGHGCFTWQTNEDARDILSAAGLEVLERIGIGCCSGLAGDPLSDILNPAVASDLDRKNLLSLELAIGKALPDCGRYMLFVARKPAAARVDNAGHAQV
jgi:SAM-dependent methyltransferase